VFYSSCALSRHPVLYPVLCFIVLCAVLLSVLCPVVCGSSGDWMKMKRMRSVLQTNIHPTITIETLKQSVLEIILHEVQQAPDTCLR